MKELIDKLWAGIASAGGRVVLPSDGEVILPSSKNFIMDAGEGNITLKLPETTGVTEPFVCEFSVDHDFDLIENKDLTKRFSYSLLTELQFTVKVGLVILHGYR